MEWFLHRGAFSPIKGGWFHTLDKPLFLNLSEYKRIKDKCSGIGLFSSSLCFKSMFNNHRISMKHNIEKNDRSWDINNSWFVDLANNKRNI